ncbi:hypothetical protein [uncultured Roseobacter sp.]|uniref:hypothetical protein n=1 Tax=uncultured Roseobacter sp. TaxID=114847 RepID=UPI0026187F64|nr:hypothetical protein [uncultured Roseobacter sp.]
MTDTTSLEWSPVAILPNIEIEGELGNRYGSISSVSHPNIAPLLDGFPELKEFTGRFSDSFGERVRPSFVLFNQAVKERHQNSQAFLAFRNSIAVPLATYGRCLMLKNGSPHTHPMWTDSFDCYPWMLGKDLKNLVISSGALKGFHEVKKFNGQSSPQLPHRFLSNAGGIDLLSDRLLEIWSNTFVKKQQIKTHVPIFRSLEMAYEAGRVPFQYAQTDTDHGRLIALWISAFEILAHPGKGNVALKDVLRLLDGYEPAQPKRIRSKKYSVKLRNTRKSVDLLEKTYRHLYGLRNDYLHGNPRSFASLVPRGFSINLLHAAPALYRICLFSKLAIKPPRIVSVDDTNEFAAAIFASSQFNQCRSIAENAVLAARYGNLLTNEHRKSGER